MTRIAVHPVKRQLIEQLARILGPSSAAHKALADCDYRRALGEANIGFFMVPDSHIIFVGPKE